MGLWFGPFTSEWCFAVLSFSLAIAVVRSFPWICGCKLKEWELYHGIFTTCLWYFSGASDLALPVSYEPISFGNGVLLYGSSFMLCRSDDSMSGDIVACCSTIVACCSTVRHSVFYHGPIPRQELFFKAQTRQGLAPVLERLALWFPIRDRKKFQRAYQSASGTCRPIGSTMLHSSSISVACLVVQTCCRDLPCCGLHSSCHPEPRQAVDGVILCLCWATEGV